MYAICHAAVASRYDVTNTHDLPITRTPHFTSAQLSQLPFQNNCFLSSLRSSTRLPQRPQRPKEKAVILIRLVIYYIFSADPSDMDRDLTLMPIVPCV